MRFRVISGCFLLFCFSFGADAQVTIFSPDKKISLTTYVSPQTQIFYRIAYGGKEVLEPSLLGLKVGMEDFTTGLKMTDSGRVMRVSDTYTLLHGKKSQVTAAANVRTISYVNNEGNRFEVTFSISNDGVAFRYHLPGDAFSAKRITAEVTSFNFPTEAKGWLQPMQVSKTGFEQTNPAYEEHYQMEIPVGTASTQGAGWVYPALFRANNIWVLITEAGVESHHCATRLSHLSPDGEYSVAFPDAREIIPGKNLLPIIVKDYTSPWRIIAIGPLAAIVENTLGTDYAGAKAEGDFSFVKPGKASWSWINSKDDFITYDEQKKYIDFASDMKWQYCLVDAAWDKKIGYEKIAALAEYAKTKGVKLLLWYNSAGDWNTVKFTPKDLMLTQDVRVREFNRLKQMGIAGVKIDFFAGDGQSVMAYYLDILKDAAAVGLLVNFHGATLPRGWARTYPNLVTTEAVRGFEMVTFGQWDADKQASHCAMLPFTRNVYDPMDYTPMNLYKIQTGVKRKTTAVFELALSVLFTSGIQHFAESPEGMSYVPASIRNFLRNMPDTWDDVRFVDGFPGQYVVIARRAQNKWYISGINGSEKEVNIKINPQAFGNRKAWMVTDGSAQFSFSERQPELTKPIDMNIKPSGGFVMIIE